MTFDPQAFSCPNLPSISGDSEGALNRLLGYCTGFHPDFLELLQKEIEQTENFPE